MPERNGLAGLGVWALIAPVLCGALSGGGEPDFKRASPEQTLKFLQTLRRGTGPIPSGRSPKPWVDMTVEDIRRLRYVHPGHHTNRDGEPARHVRLKPSDWWYFTGFEQLEVFEMLHDIEGVDDSCFLYVGHLPQTLRRLHLEMSEATGEGVKHLQNLKNLRALSLNFSRRIGDVALVHAAGIRSLEYLDVNGCPRITGTGVAALAKLENLKVLKIGGCSLSDASLEHFKNLSIEELDLSDNVAEWVIRRRGGGKHRFTVSFDGLKRLLADKDTLPNLRRLIVGKSRRSLLKGEILSKSQKAALARLRPGLKVR